MKSIQIFLVVYVLIFSFAGACSNDDESPSNPNPAASSIIGTWKMTGATRHGVDTFNLPETSFQLGTNGSQIYGLRNCLKDNITTWSASSYVIDEGPLKCSANAPQTHTIQYTINSQQTLLTITTPTGGQATLSILSLNSTTLKLQSSNGGGIDTLTRQ